MLMLGKEIEKTFKSMMDNLRKRAETEFMSSIKVLKDYKKLKTVEGGFWKSHWCGDEKCAETLEKGTSFEIRGEPFESKEKEGTCFACGKKGKVVYIAKAY